MNVQKNTSESEQPTLCVCCQTYYGSPSNKGMCSTCFKYILINLEKETMLKNRKQTSKLVRRQRRVLQSRIRNYKRSKNHRKNRLIASDVSLVPKNQDYWVLNVNAVLCSVTLTDSLRITVASSISSNKGKNGYRKPW